jgi:hypothetical protein
MKPHAFHWDQVLLAWKECTDWDKVAHAAKIFLEKRAEGLVDVTAYITLLRICGHDHANEKAALLGAKVAVKLWQVVMEEESEHVAGGPTVEDLPSHFYGHFLQAIRCLPAGSMREYYFDACFAAACKHGKVDAVIINEFIVHVNSRSQSIWPMAGATKTSCWYFVQIHSCRVAGACRFEMDGFESVNESVV